MSNKESILVLNAGSTSLKYKLFNIKNFEILKQENFNNLGQGKKNHLQAFISILRSIGDLTNIKIVGHRVVHGGQKFYQPTLINDEIIKELAKFNHLAPLHNPYCLKVIESARAYLSNIPHLAVFDTAFFTTLPLKAKIYAIPIKYYKEDGIQRFGFHGISHQYVAKKAAEKMKKKLEKINLITCHLGGGCSIAAIKQGKAIDTSMGYTPLEGLVMMTRPGDIDSGLILHLIENSNLSEQEVYNLLNYESGVKGLFGSGVFLELLKAVKKGDKKAKLAFEIFVYHIQKYISAYYGILGKVQAVVFTGAIGAGDSYTRRKICQNLNILKNTKILSIPSNEELAIAQECQKLI